MFSSVVKKRYLALAAPLLLFSIACTGEVGTTPTPSAPTATPPQPPPTPPPQPPPTLPPPAPADTPTPMATPKADTGNQVGDLAHDFTLTEVSTGQSVRLAELTEQGRPVVVYFFTTW